VPTYTPTQLAIQPVQQIKDLEKMKHHTTKN